jgi:transposase
MLPLAGQHRILLYRQPTDMRKSFDGLSVIISALMSRDPLSGDIYVFINRRRDRIKLLLWDRGGFWIFYKRLESGTFELPATSFEHDTVELPYENLMMLIEGIDLTSVRRRKRFTFPKKVLA